MTFAVPMVLENKKCQNYEKTGENLFSYGTLECNMHLKFHFIHSLLDFIPDMEAVSDDENKFLRMQLKLKKDTAQME